MNKTVLVLRHMYSSSPFTIETVFRALGYDLTVIEGFSCDLARVNPLEPDVLVVLGGAMGVYEADLYPYLYQEIDILKARVAADRPTLGICLGAQLMAASQGQRVYKGDRGREFGFRLLTLTESGMDSPLRHFAPEKTRVLQMHGDTFDLPPGATLLASSNLYRNQAFRLGSACFGVQFHPEVNQAGFENLLVEENGKFDIASFRALGQTWIPVMERQTTLFLKELAALWEKNGKHA